MLINSPSMTYTIVAGGVTTQYAQKIVRLIRRSKASPEAACVICVARKTEARRHEHENEKTRRKCREMRRTYLSEGQRRW